MKARNRNAYWKLLLLTPIVFLTLPHQKGQLQTTEAPAAVFTVTNNSDAGAGSFRQAIIDANASAGTDTIPFQIGTGPVDINLNSALPDITQPVIIDGTTQPGFSGTPLITLGGNFNVGLKITGGSSTVKALALTGFPDGIVLESAGGNIVTGCSIGFCPQNPTVDCRNFGNGVLINNSPNNQIGGPTAAERNIIGGNSDNGVEITGSAASGNIITGNYIGLLADNTIKKNEDSGVFINGAPNNRVGGTTAVELNVISGNGFDGPFNESLSGVRISGGAATGNTVQGNFIGTTINGMTRATQFDNNGSNNIRIEGAANNTIGGTAGTTPGGACTGACNLISGNPYNGGVYITGSGATGNSVLGNFIGTNAVGTGIVSNDTGVTITAAASNNTVGGTTATARNLITNGMILTAGAATNTVQGNYIGTDTTGNIAIGTGTIITNFLLAVGIDSAPNNTIGTAAGTTLGGACTGGCNLISGNNASHGVFITGAGSTGNRVDHNYIGVNAAGTTALRNGGDAIALQNGANNNIIGRPLGYSYQSTTPAPATTFLIQDDVTGNFMEYDTATRQYRVKSCRSGVISIGTVPAENVFQNGTTIRVHDNGTFADFRLIFDTFTGRGSGYATQFPVGGPPSETIHIQDTNISNNVGDCPTESMQTIVGDVSSGVNNDPNPPNNNKYNFNSLGWDAKRLNRLSLPLTDGYVRHRAGSFNVYSNLDIATNGANFPPISVASGTDNSVTGLKWSGVGPGSMVNFTTDLNDNQTRDPNDPLDADGGANRTQNHPTISFVRRQRIGDDNFVIVNAQFHSTPNTSFYLFFDIQTTRYSTFFPDLELTEIEEGQYRTVTTDANGNASVEFDMFESEAAAVFFGKSSIVARAGVVTQVPITSANPTGVILGDTSEYSPPAIVPRPKADFDNDGKTDISVWRPSDGTWHILQSGGGIRVQGWGVAGDRMAPADFDGDGTTDLAVFRPIEGNWYVLNSFSNTVSVVGWGLATDLLVPGDYSGDDSADFAVYRPSDHNWYIRDSQGRITVREWGLDGDKPVPADYDGDGRKNIAVFRPSEGRWYVIGGSVSIDQWGLAGDLPVPSDYSGDGKADLCVFRPSDNTWYRRHSEDNSIHIITWGLAGDLPAPGDFDGDGKTDLAVWRPVNGTWFIFASEAGIYQQPFGLAGDLPTPNAFVY